MNLDHLLEQIERAAPGPQTAALFDFDGTLIAGYSATVFLRDQLASGELSRAEFLELTRALAAFGMGSLGFSALMTTHAQFLKGRLEADYWETSERLFRKGIARLIYPEARALVAAHQAKGHTVAIISSATPYQVEPAARDLGIDTVHTTRLEVKRGKFTGKVERPTVFGEGKVLAAEAVAKQVRADLDQAFFYSDSTDDIQLLERVGRPVVLNPRKRLRGIAGERNWPVASFDSRGRAGLGRFVRSVAATASIVPSFAAGVPISALTGSARDGVNFSLSLFSDAASALIGLDLEIKGQENLWKQRPALFMFNHQSKADVVIMASLLRRDIAGIGKKEIRRIPIIGKVLELGGVVMIDRSDPAGAIEAMKPLVRAMREEGKSVVMAPEGTRTPTRKLAPFKKGGFHLAMQAGVPIVPVVIHNAGDIAPKGDFVFRPGTVRVEVLPPVDTSGWSTSTMNSHVVEVRNLFLRALGQPEQTVAEAIRDRRNLAADQRPESQGGKARKTAATKAPATTTKTKTKTKVKAKPAGKAKSTAKPKAKAKPAPRTKARPEAKTKTKSAPTTKAKPPTKAKPRARPKATRASVKPKLADKG